MKRSFVLLGQFCLCLATLLLAAGLGKEFFFRHVLVYNEMGRHFDKDNLVVYNEQAIPFYGLSFVICLIAVFVVCRWTLRTQRFQNNKN